MIFFVLAGCVFIAIVSHMIWVRRVEREQLAEALRPKAPPPAPRVIKKGGPAPSFAPKKYVDVEDEIAPFIPSLYEPSPYSIPESVLPDISSFGGGESGGAGASGGWSDSGQSDSGSCDTSSASSCCDSGGSCDSGSSD